MLGTQQTLHLNLLDNGIDFILKGIDELFDDGFEFRDYIHPNEVTIRSYKYGSLHLFAGFLLILKERLYRCDPSCIFRDSNKRNNQVTQNRKVRTIDYAASKKLLKEKVGFSFSNDEEEIIESVQDFRNSLEHYNVESIDIYNTWRNLSSFLRIIDQFLVKELHIIIEDLPEAASVTHKIHHVTSILERMERQRKEEWRRDAEQRAERLRSLRTRVQSKLEPGEDIEDALDVYQEELIFCPDCYCETLVASGEYIDICLNDECEEVNPIAECDRCGELTVGFPWEVNFCDNCQDDIDRA